MTYRWHALVPFGAPHWSQNISNEICTIGENFIRISQIILYWLKIPSGRGEVVRFVLLESRSTLDKISRSRNGIEVKLLPQCLQTTDGDWWCQYLCQVTGVYPLDWKIYYTHIYIIHHWKTLECSLYFITFWCSSWNDCGLSTKANWTLDLAGQKIFFPKKAAQKVLPHLNFLSLIL